jgi:hypothetical protein
LKPLFPATEIRIFCHGVKEEDMNTIDRGRVILAAVLIGLGLLFLVFNIIPGYRLAFAWPVLILLVAVAMLLPPFLWPHIRQGLAALWIPGIMLLVLSLIFFYNTATGDWSAWGFLWILLPASAGLGLAFAALIGRWGQPVVWVGLAIAISGLLVFSLFAFIFGSRLLQAVGPVGLIVLGIVVLLGAFRRPVLRAP